MQQRIDLRIIVGVAATLNATNISAEAAGLLDPSVVSETILPAAAQLGLGAVIGFCVGYLVKTVGKYVALSAGFVFIVIQVLAYMEIVTVDWPILFVWWEDPRNQASIERMWTIVRSILFDSMPLLVGAVPGLLLG